MHLKGGFIILWWIQSDTGERQRQSQREPERETETETERPSERHRDRQTDRQRHTDREIQGYNNYFIESSILPKDKKVKQS